MLPLYIQEFHSYSMESRRKASRKHLLTIETCTHTLTLSKSEVGQQNLFDKAQIMDNLGLTCMKLYTQ